MATRGAEWEPQISFKNFGPRLDPEPKSKLTQEVSDTRANR
jgi:hypothetical protein